MILGSTLAAEVAAGLAAACLLVLVAAVIALLALVRAVRGVQASLDRLGDEVLPALGSLRRLASVPAVLDVGPDAGSEGGHGVSVPRHGVSRTGSSAGERGAEALGLAFPRASRLAWLALSEPLIKLLAAGSGAAEAARSFRQRRSG
jgi:hypothetical protein